MLLEDEETDQDGSNMTLPDKLFKAHLSKLAMVQESDISTLPVKPRIITKAKEPSVRNGLKDKFVLNIIESFNDDSNVLKELSNMKLSSSPSTNPEKSVKSTTKRRKSVVAIKKTWNSIINLAIGVPPSAGSTAGSESRKKAGGDAKSAADQGTISSLENENLKSLYSETMYSSIIGDMYKSRSTACIAAL